MERSADSDVISFICFPPVLRVVITAVSCWELGAESGVHVTWPKTGVSLHARAGET